MKKKNAIRNKQEQQYSKKKDDKIENFKKTKEHSNDQTIYLPDLNTQHRIARVIDTIEKQKKKLFEQPKKINPTLKGLERIYQENTLENWIDKLPFPISSILWRYSATTSSQKKIEHLFHFFEAFSEFLSMIILSALVQNQEFYKSYCNRWLDNDEKFKNWYLRATFGSWNMLTSRLSKFIRCYISDNRDAEFCFELFGKPSYTFLEMLANKRLVNILTDVAELRNKWKGHGGITSEKENSQRILKLEKLLVEFKKVISDAFDETTIISPTTSSFENGVFTFTAKQLIGARTPFNEIKLKSLIPLDRKKLYLLHAGQSTPIELLPFIKFFEESEAIYFYSSIESKTARWVSYHFDKEAEIKQPIDESLFKAFDFLKL